MALYKIDDGFDKDISYALNEFNSMLTDDYFTREEAEKLFYSEGMNEFQADFIFTWNEYHSCYTLQRIQTVDYGN